MSVRKLGLLRGDSLTEGIGSTRVSYVTELASQLRAADGGKRAVNELRLRKVDPSSFNRFIRFNLAGYLNTDALPSPRRLWLWNLACEGQTIETDAEWLPLLDTLRPDRVIVYRGSLESIVRPAMLRDGSWPGGCRTRGANTPQWTRAVTSARRGGGGPSKSLLTL